VKEAGLRFESPALYFQEATSLLLGIQEDARRGGVVGIAQSDLIQSYRALVEKAIITAAKEKNLSLEETFSFLKCFGEETDDLIDPRPLQEYFAAFNGHIKGERFLAWEDFTYRIVDCFGHSLNLGEYQVLQAIRNLEELLFKPAISAAGELVDYSF
jgi:hypothetical protein